MNKTLLFLLASLSLQINAGTMGSIAAPVFFDGPYIGLGGGGTFGVFKTISELTAEGIQNLGQIKATETNFIGTGVLGYGKSLNHIYLGGELYGNWGKVKSNSIFNFSELQSVPFIFNFQTDINSNVSVRLNQGEFGIDGRLGWLTSPSTLVFARVGAGFNEIHINSHSTFARIDVDGVDPTISISSDLNEKKSKTALRLGAGLEQMITDQFSIRGDYIYENYGTLSGNVIVTIPSINIPFTNANSVNFSTHSILATALWHFNF